MRASRGDGGRHRRWWVATDEPGYPCIAQRWTGSDAARCVPWPRDAASPTAGRSKTPEQREKTCEHRPDRSGRAADASTRPDGPEAAARVHHPTP